MTQIVTMSQVGQLRMVKAQGTLQITTKSGDIFVQKSAMVTLRQHECTRLILCFSGDCGAYGRYNLSAGGWSIGGMKKLKSKHKKGRSILLCNDIDDCYVKSIQLSFEITTETDFGAAFTAMLPIAWKESVE